MAPHLVLLHVMAATRPEAATRDIREALARALSQAVPEPRPKDWDGLQVRASHRGTLNVSTAHRTWTLTPAEAVAYVIAVEHRGYRGGLIDYRRWLFENTRFGRDRLLNIELRALLQGAAFHGKGKGRVDDSPKRGLPTEAREPVLFALEYAESSPLWAKAARAMGLTEHPLEFSSMRSRPVPYGAPDFASAWAQMEVHEKMEAVAIAIRDEYRGEAPSDTTVPKDLDDVALRIGVALTTFLGEVVSAPLAFALVDPEDAAGAAYLEDRASRDYFCQRLVEFRKRCNTSEEDPRKDTAKALQGLARVIAHAGELLPTRKSARAAYDALVKVVDRGLLPVEDAITRGSLRVMREEDALLAVGGAPWPGTWQDPSAVKSGA